MSSKLDLAKAVSRWYLNDGFCALPSPRFSACSSQALTDVFSLSRVVALVPLLDHFGPLPYDTIRLRTALMSVRQCQTCAFCVRRRDSRALGRTMLGSSQQPFGVVWVEHGAMQGTASIRNPRVFQLARVAPLMHVPSEDRKENLFSGCLYRALLCSLTYFIPEFDRFFKNRRKLFYHFLFCFTNVAPHWF